MSQVAKLFINGRSRHSIRVNDQWRVCFIWRDRAAHQVTILDYH